MNRFYNFVSLVIALALLGTSPLLAQTTGKSNVHLVSTLTLEQFQGRVQALGFQCERGSTDGKLDEYFTFRADGRKVAAKVVIPEYVELFVYYSDGTSLSAVNEWNTTHFASTAFIDKEGDAVLENLLMLTGGVSDENINNFITNFRDSASDYAHFILDHAKGGKNE